MDRQELLRENYRLKEILQLIRSVIDEYHSSGRPISVTDEIIEIDNIIKKLF